MWTGEKGSYEEHEWDSSYHYENLTKNCWSYEKLSQPVLWVEPFCKRMK